MTAWSRLLTIVALAGFALPDAATVADLTDYGAKLQIELHGVQ
jgi:hypothetical protein